MRIKVKAVKGRIARTAPDGPFIPHDKFVPVEKTKYIARLLEHHGDIEQEPAKVKAEQSVDKKADTKATTGQKTETKKG